MPAHQQRGIVAAGGIGSLAQAVRPGQVGDRPVGTERNPLEHRRQKRAVPVVGPHLRQPARIGDGDKGGQVTVLRAQSVTHPGAHAGKTIQREARAHLVLARPMRVAFGRHRMDEAKFVGQRGQIGQQIADHLARLAPRLECPQRLVQIPLRPLEGDQLVATRKRLPVPFHQLGLVVEGVKVAQRPRAENHQRLVRPGPEMRQARRQRVTRVHHRSDRCGCRLGFLRQQRRQRDATQPPRRVGQKVTPIEQRVVHRHHSTQIHSLVLNNARQNASSPAEPIRSIPAPRSAASGARE